MRILGPMVLATVLMGCGPAVGNPSGVVTGTVSADGLKDLPEDAVLTVSLVDYTSALGDGPADPMASQGFTKASFPLPFKLRMDASQIDERRSYTVSAEIRRYGKLLSVPDRFFDVPTRGSPNQVSVVMIKVSDPAPQP